GHVMLNFPNARVSSDTRSNLLFKPDDFYEFFKLYSERPAFDEYVQANNIDMVFGLQKLNDDNMFRFVAEGPEFLPLAYDDYFYLWSKTHGARSIARTFWFTECFDQIDKDLIAQDIERLKTILRADSVSL